MPDQVTPAAVRDAVWTVLRDDSSERAAARTLAAEIAAMPSAAEVVNELMSIANRPGAAA
jgi:UDP:flavonoid glycosyltransferase YjiC (YdhE family)